MMLATGKRKMLLQCVMQPIQPMENIRQASSLPGQAIPGSWAGSPLPSVFLLSAWHAGIVTVPVS